MPLDECLAKHSVRVKNLWMKWLERQWDNPSRSDFYLMRVALEVFSVLNKRPKTLDDFRVKFNRESAPSQSKTSPSSMTREQAASIATRQWMSRFGSAARVIVKSPDGRVISDSGAKDASKSSRPGTPDSTTSG